MNSLRYGDLEMEEADFMCFDFGQPKFDLALKVCGLSFVFSLDLEFYNAPFCDFTAI
jgi:hypothetical protein